MRWSFASIVLRARDPAPPGRDERRRTFAWARRTGFEGIELSPLWLDTDPLTPRSLRTLRAEIAAEDLVVSGLNLNRVVLTRSPHADAHRERIARAIDAASCLGARIVNVSLSLPAPAGNDRPVLRGVDVPLAEHERSVALVRELADTAARAGVVLSLELHDDGLLDTARWCLWHVTRVASPACALNPDLGNICRAPGRPQDWAAALAALAPQAACWHIKNYRNGRPSPIWDGDIDYTSALAHMQAAAFEGWVSIESYFGNDVLDLQKGSLEWAREQLQRLRTGPTSSSAPCQSSSI